MIWRGMFMDCSQTSWVINVMLIALKKIQKVLCGQILQTEKEEVLGKCFVEEPGTLTQLASGLLPDAVLWWITVLTVSGSVAFSNIRLRKI